MSEEIEYTDEQVAADIVASMDSVSICETVQAITEGDRTEAEVGDLFRNEGHLRIKMAKSKFVAGLSSAQKSKIDALSL